MTNNEVEIATAAHRRCSVLLRAWLGETHTPVGLGVLELDIGPVRVFTEITYFSVTGAHAFGPIRVGGRSGTLGPEVSGASMPGTGVAGAEPMLLAAAMSTQARTRAVADAPINSGGWTLVDALVHAFAVPGRDLDPLAGHARVEHVHNLVVQPDNGPPPLVEAVTRRAAAHRWLADHTRTVVLPAMRAASASDVEPTDLPLTRSTLTAIGMFGRHGVADERELLDQLASGLRHFAATSSEPEAARCMAGSWLRRPTLTAVAALNGSRLRYRTDLDSMLPITVDPVPYEIPNPLCESSADAEVPGPPLPELPGGWSLRPVELDASEDGPDAALVHAWMNSPHVARTWHQAWSWGDWRKELATQLGGSHSMPCIVSRDGRELAYVEVYRVSRDTLARTYPYGVHDLGVHIAIGAPDATGRGAGSSLLNALALGLLAADPRCRRVVAEPDVHNGASVRAFAKAGFVHEREVGLPSKDSALMVFSR